MRNCHLYVKMWSKRLKTSLPAPSTQKTAPPHGTAAWRLSSKVGGPTRAPHSARPSKAGTAGARDENSGANGGTKLRKPITHGLTSR